MPCDPLDQFSQSAASLREIVRKIRCILTIVRKDELIAKACDIFMFYRAAVCHELSDLSLILRGPRIRQSRQLHATGDIECNLVVKAPIEINQHCLSFGKNEFQLKDPIISNALAQSLCLVGKKRVDKSRFKAQSYPDAARLLQNFSCAAHNHSASNLFTETRKRVDIIDSLRVILLNEWRHR